MSNNFVLDFVVSPEAVASTEIDRDRKKWSAAATSMAFSNIVTRGTAHAMVGAKMTRGEVSDAVGIEQMRLAQNVRWTRGTYNVDTSNMTVDEILAIGKGERIRATDLTLIEYKRFLDYLGTTITEQTCPERVYGAAPDNPCTTLSDRQRACISSVEPTTELARRLQLARVCAGYTSYELSDNTSFGRGCIFMTEWGCQEPPMYELVRIAKLCHVSPDWLAYGGEIEVEYDGDTPLTELCPTWVERYYETVEEITKKDGDPKGNFSNARKRARSKAEEGDAADISIIRLSLGLDIVDAADIIGITVGTLYEYETGVRHMRPRTRKRVLAAYEAKSRARRPAEGDLIG